MVQELIFDDDNQDDVENFDALFDNEDDDKKYIIFGRIQLWDGYSDGHHPNVFNSIKDALLGCKDGFGICYMKVFEDEDTGELTVRVSHHDGVNHLTIKELTPLGEEMDNNYQSVSAILNNKDATKNVEYSK